MRKDFDTTKHAVESWMHRLRSIVSTAKVGMDIAVYGAGFSPRGRKYMKDHHFCEDTIQLFTDIEKIIHEMDEEVAAIDDCRKRGKKREGARDGN